MVGSAASDRGKEAEGMMALHEALSSIYLKSDSTYFIFWTIHLRSNFNMSEAQKRSMTVGVKHSNGYLNGSIPLRSLGMVSEVDEFCHAFGGKNPIHSILIANNGMVDVKFICSIRTWACETLVLRRQFHWWQWLLQRT